MASGQPRLHLGQELAIGIEHAVHLAYVPGPERRLEQTGIPAVAIMARAQATVVGDVAGRLLQVGHQATSLEHLGQEVGGLFAGQVDAAQLGHRIVAVLEEDLLVELLGPLDAHGGVHRGVAGDVQLTHELVEEQPAEALGRARVAGEQGALHHLGQVDQGKHRQVQVCAVPPQDVLFFGGERLDGVGKHARITLRLGSRVSGGSPIGRVVGRHHPSTEQGDGHLGGIGRGRHRCHLGQLAKQVHQLADVAHEVARGHLAVGQDRRQQAPLGPAGDRSGQPRVGAPGPGQALAALLGSQAPVTAITSRLMVEEDDLNQAKRVIAEAERQIDD